MTSAQMYRRDARGNKVHRADCRTLGPGQGSEWKAADGLDEARIAERIDAYPWLTACKVCRPDVAA